MRVEIRNNEVIIEGYVNAVARDSRPIPSQRGRFIEQIVPRTFERALQNAENVDILLNHHKDRHLGSTKEGTLELFEDSIGLRAFATITDPEVIEKAKKNQLRGWSFGFLAKKDRWEDSVDGNLSRRYVEELELREVSIIDNTKLPAYTATSIETREDSEFLTEIRSIDLEIRVVDNSTEEEKVKFDNSDYMKRLEKLKK